MRIEDDELRELYKASSTERLSKLEQGILHLEQHPDDSAKLEELLRETHTLKGDSRMLGLNDIEMLVHQLEDGLAAIKRGEEQFNPQSCDRYYQALDAISQLSHQAITGEAVEVNTFQVLALLMGADLESSSESEALPEDDLFDEQLELEEDEENNLDLQQQTKAAEVAPVDSTKHQINTIRVAPEKLDALMSQAGELTVTKQHIANQIGDIEQLINLWEEWNKEAHSYRLLFKKIEQSVSDEYSKLFQNFVLYHQQRLERLENFTTQLKEKTEKNSTSLDLVSNQLEKGIRNLRLLPLANVFNLFSRMVRDLAKEQQKQINLIIEGGNTLADKQILEEIKDPLMHIIRNAIDHGIETPQARQSKGKSPTATIRLRGYQTGSSITVEIQDDGRGLDTNAIKQTALAKGIHTEAELESMSEAKIQALIFTSGFSTRTTVTDLSGRGVGLDVVRANVEKLKGNIEVSSTPGQGCLFRLQISTAIATTTVLIIKINQNSYALPIEPVVRILLLSQEEIFTLQGQQTITIKEQPVTVRWLADLLNLPVNIPNSASVNNASKKTIPCIVLKLGNELLGFLVDDILGKRNIILKPQSKLLQKVPNFAGATILDSGEVCLVINSQDLSQSTSTENQSSTHQFLEQAQTKQNLLLVEDSIVIRTQMKRILESAGYNVVTAVDGLDGLNKLEQGNFDGIVSDIEMPNLDGLTLTERIRQNPKYRELPIILVTTLAKDEDKRRGAEIGANAYLTKGDFDQALLLDTLKRFI